MLLGYTSSWHFDTPLGLWPLGAVLGAALSSVSHSQCVFRTPDDMVAYPGKVLYPAASQQYYGVLLKVMTNTRDVSGNFDIIGQAYPGNFPKCGVRLLRRNRHYPGANSPFLWAGLQCG